MPHGTLLSRSERQLAQRVRPERLDPSSAGVMNQRWRARRDLYRPAGEVINTREYEIAETRSDRIVKDFIATHHYLQTTPPARFRFCLYKGEQLVGVAVFAHPTNDRSHHQDIRLRRDRRRGIITACSAG